MCRLTDLLLWTSLVVCTIANQQILNNPDVSSLSALAERIANMEKETYKMAELYRQQSAETDRLTRENAHLEKRMRKAEKINLKLSTKIDSLTQELKQMKKEKIIFSKFEKQEAVKGHASDFGMSKSLRNRRLLLGNSVNTLVGFTAYLDHNVDHLGIDQTIVFNQILFNDGGGYNHATGMFTCPVFGVYLFFFEVGSGSQHQIVAKLVVDGYNRVGAIADSDYHAYDEAQGGNMAILKLSAGSRVWVENYRWANKFVEGDTIDRFTTFSGILLYQY